MARVGTVNYSQQGEETAYELTHERMIPAVIKISGKILPKAYRANELLNQLTASVTGDR
jgi:hypothetical protein